MKRGGQVFFLHNRVKTIDHMRSRIAQLVPEARILGGHGQMDKDDLELVMHTFVKGDADVLLATTIIETGIDIPNANTILIDRADRFGLADLYQLRGRVGRAGEQAYAILLLPRDMMTVGDARKRIHAIKQYTALGSGFKIAMRDLEIRGAGNLLGTRQSGHIAQIGFDLYCQLLRQSVERLKNRHLSPSRAATFKADFIVTSEAAWSAGVVPGNPVVPAGKSGVAPEREDGRPAGLQTSDASPRKDARPRPSSVVPEKADPRLARNFSLPAFIPAAWLGDTPLRIAAYRELADATTETAVDTLESSWRDRHGRLPPPAARLLEIARIKALAAALGIASVEIQGQRLMLHRNGEYILLEGRRFPRLQSATTEGKLPEALRLLKNF